MADFEIHQYNPAVDLDRWNEFIGQARNGTFLFNRNYMDYHNDRFCDNSLMAFRNGKLCAVLPAHIVDNQLCSHNGLTYGGWIFSKNHFDGNSMMEMWQSWIEYCRGIGVKKIIYKPIPHTYSQIPAQEDIYALFRFNAKLVECNLSSVIDLQNKLGFNMSKRQQLKKALRRNLTIIESDNFREFWAMLELCLRQRHDAMPVHSVEEIELLASRFPDNIRLFTVSDDEGMQAGCVVYDTEVAIHSQYTATTEKARKEFHLTALYHHLINTVFAGHRYFDFGTSNENHGQILNAGLLNQKYSMGGTGVVYTKWEIPV